MGNNVVLADSLAPIPEWQVWCNAFKDSLSAIDLTQLLVYIIDSVDVSAIPYLAKQLDVLGYKGMRIAQTESAQRELLKNAIILHKYKGTEWGIQQALASIGFTDIKLKRGIAGGYDHWAKFGLEITNTSLVLTDKSITDIQSVIAEYKRAVCILVDISMTILVNDTLTLDDLVYVNPALIALDILQLTGSLQYDGENKYDGTFTHSGESDVVTIN